MSSNQDLSSRPLPRRKPFNPAQLRSPPPAPAPLPSDPPADAQPQPRSTPTRSKSRLTADAPHDASKPDDEAVDDVMDRLEETGSLERAARKLQLYAKLTGQGEQSASGSGVASVGERGAGRSGSKERAVRRSAEEAAARRELERAKEDEYALDDDEDEEDEDARSATRGQREVIDQGEVELERVVHLQEILEGLWVGDLVSAMDSAGLEERGITNIVSLLRPKLSFPPQFAVFPLEIDDSPDTDILTHLPTCVAWIAEALRRRERSIGGSDTSDTPESERDALTRKLPVPKAGGVLVHCQAGMSRSATVAAAYLMTALSLDPASAVEMIKDRRPVVDPSETFLRQLGLFHHSDGKVSLRDRDTRHFYMERNAAFFMNGQTALPATDKMAKYPATPTPSNPPTPSGGHGRRKIRCKMCRRLLAVREHMMDHILDQSPVSRPRTPSIFALPAPMTSIGRQSIDEGAEGGQGGGAKMERRTSVVSDIVNPLTGLPGARSRQPSMSGTDRPSLSSSVEMVPRASTPGLVLTAMTPVDPSRSPVTEKESVVLDSPGPMSRSDTLDQAGRRLAEVPLSPSRRNRSVSSLKDTSNGASQQPQRTLQSADQLASRLPPHLQALRSGSGHNSPQEVASPINSSPPSSPEADKAQTFGTGPGAGPQGSNSSAGSSSAGQGSGNDAIVRTSSSVARRRSLLSMTTTDGLGARDRRGSASAFGGELASGGPPILVNPRCSGYFVEPLTWMEPVLKNGDISGKLLCPNEKCGAKIGNFDWAGVQCGCREWVTPGFCISRSKVDEVW